MNQKNLKAAFIFLVLIALSVLMGGGYWVAKSQKNEIRRQEEQVQRLKQIELSLKQDLDKLQNRQRKIIGQNRNYRDETKRYNEQKKVILEQVRSSVAGFETFRQSATEEIVRLKESMDSLETAKKATEDKLHSVETLSAEEKDKLTGEVFSLGEKIEQLKATQSKLVENLNNKDRSSLVGETAKLHYNLGNYYFRNGEHANAAAEYKKVIFYRPDDADANFNLGLVSDDYLDDRQTAIFRYKRYLELRPHAVDHKKIRRRILDLELRDKVIDEPAKKEAHEIFRDKDNSGLSNFRFIGDKP